MPTALADYLQAPVPYLIGMPTDEIEVETRAKNDEICIKNDELCIKGMKI